jgi:hypothetical protein
VRWNHVLVPLSRLRSNLPPRDPLAIGTPVNWLQFLLRYNENDILFVDNVEIVQFAPL